MWLVTRLGALALLSNVFVSSHVSAQMMGGSSGMHGSSGSYSSYMGGTHMSSGSGSGHMSNGSGHGNTSNMPMMNPSSDGTIQVVCPRMTPGQSHMRTSVHAVYMGQAGNRLGMRQVMGHGQRVAVPLSLLCKHVAAVKVYCTVSGPGSTTMTSNMRNFDQRMCKR